MVRASFTLKCEVKSFGTEKMDGLSSQVSPHLRVGLVDLTSSQLNHSIKAGLAEVSGGYLSVGLTASIP